MPEETASDKLHISLNYKHLVWALLALNVLTIFLWRPWEGSASSDRTIRIVGEATIKAQPDEYQFSPSYEFTANSQKAVLAEATKKADEVVKELKALGVADEKISLSASSYDNWWYDDDKDEYNSQIIVSIEVDDKNLAQKIQDYLVESEAQGQLTPWPTFSDETRKALEDQARQEALANARVKAEQSVEELGARLGKVVSVEDGHGFDDYPIFYGRDAVESTSAKDSGSSFPIQPGEQDFTFSITVTFELK